MAKQINIENKDNKMILSYDIRKDITYNMPLIIFFSVAFIGCIIYCIKSMVQGEYGNALAWLRLILIIGAIGIFCFILFMRKSKYRLIIDQNGFTEISLCHKSKTIYYNEVTHFACYYGGITKSVQRYEQYLILVSKSDMEKDKRTQFVISQSRWGGALKAKSPNDIIIVESAHDAYALFSKIKKFAAEYNPNSSIFLLDDE